MPTSTPPFVTFLNSFGATFGAQSKQFAETAIAAYAANITWLQVLGVLVTVGLIVGIVTLMIRLRWIETRIERYRHAILNADATKDQTKKSWKDIERHFFAGSDSDLKVAIIEADTALDSALRNAGVLGVNLGDRLKKVKIAQLPNVEDVWQAHKLRNQIAHDDTLVLKRDIAERALGIYRKALESLGALEKKNI
jgi:uncharacterized membrane-anchored protein YhcB (DUF1043 family)